MRDTCRLTLLACALHLTMATTGGVASGQTPQVFYRNVIVLDAAHGGTESGATLATDVVEKDVTLAFAARLRSLLTVRGFTVVMTRTGDQTLTSDQRAAAANRARAVACLVIHATASGAGVHVATSQLQPGGDVGGAVAWDRAQVVYLNESQRLANRVGEAIVRSHLPVVVEAAALRPLDNLRCPAAAIELAPSAASGSDAASADDDDYQEQVARALAGALVLWRNQAEPPPSVVVRPYVPYSTGEPASSEPASPAVAPTPRVPALKPSEDSSPVARPVPSPSSEPAPPPTKPGVER